MWNAVVRQMHLPENKALENLSPWLKVGAKCVTPRVMQALVSAGAGTKNMMQRTMARQSFHSVGLVSEGDTSKTDDWGNRPHNKTMGWFGDPVTIVSGNKENGSLDVSRDEDDDERLKSCQLADGEESRGSMVSDWAPALGETFDRFAIGSEWSISSEQIHTAHQLVAHVASQRCGPRVAMDTLVRISPGR